MLDFLGSQPALAIFVCGFSGPSVQNQNDPVGLEIQLDQSPVRLQ